MALIVVIIVAAVIALVQIDAAREHTQSPLAQIVVSPVAVAQSAVTAVVGAGRSATGAIVALPGLENDNARLKRDNASLTAENARLHELAAAYAAEAGVRATVAAYGGVEARVVGFPPENEVRTVTIDRGSGSGIRMDDGVVTQDGAVGRIAAVGPLTSTVVLITDFSSRIPAIVRRGRWWGIAHGNITSVRMDFVSQDAPLRAGDIIVTGEGRSFHSGVPIGTVRSVDRGDATLYQTAVVKPAVDLGALDRVVVITR
ncbi:MAG: rod shape-determining protein MreC [Candidatus Tumulicola sp.]